MRAARQLAQEFENISDEDRETLDESIDDLVKDTPMTPVAAERVRRVLAKAGKAAAEAFREIFIEVASETAKKLLWPT